MTATSAARHQASVPGRTARWKSASSAVSVRRGSMTISARSGSRAISLSVVRACGMPWDCHGFLPMKSATSACSMSPRDRGAEHRGVDPELAGLLLGEGVRAVAGAERPQGRPAVGAAEVVPLAAAAVVEDRLAAVLVAHLGEAAPRPRRWRCPSRSPRTCRRAGGAAGSSAGGGRSGSGRAAAPSRRCSPGRPGGPCRPGCARTAGRPHRRGAPRSRSCTRRGCRPWDASRPAAP